MSNSAGNPAASALQKIATIPKLYEISIHQSEINPKSVSFLVGGQDSELLVAYYNNFVWVYKYVENSKSNDLMSLSRDNSLFSSSTTDLLSNGSGTYELIAAGRVTGDDAFFISTLVVLNISKSSSSNESRSLPNTWLCLAVGLSSGGIRFFTESLDLLCEVCWAQSSVQSMRVSLMSDCSSKTQSNVRPTALAPLLHFIVLYSDQTFISLAFDQLCDHLLLWKVHSAKVKITFLFFIVASVEKSICFRLPHRVIRFLGKHRRVYL